MARHSASSQRTVRGPRYSPTPSLHIAAIQMTVYRTATFIVQSPSMRHMHCVLVSAWSRSLTMSRWRTAIVNRGRGESLPCESSVESLLGNHASLPVVLYLMYHTPHPRTVEARYKCEPRLWNTSERLNIASGSGRRWRGARLVCHKLECCQCHNSPYNAPSTNSGSQQY